jgi:hypothetical protein
MYEAWATIRDLIAYTETTKTPMDILLLDFTEAFDRVSHAYLRRILEGYGLGEKIVRLIGLLYEDALPSIHINGHVSRQIPIRR